MPINQYHRTLQSQKEFVDMIEQLKKKVPAVAAYDFSSDNYRQIVWESALRQGFNLCIAHLEQK